MSDPARSAPTLGRHGEPARPRLRLGVYTDAPIFAGAELSVATVIGHLSSSVDVTVVGPDQAVVEAIAAHRAGARAVVAPPLRSKAELGNLRRTARLLRGLGVDVVHLNKAEVAGQRYVELVALWTHPRRVVAVVHHVERAGSAAARQLSRRLAARAGAVVTVGAEPARELADLLHRPANAVCVIPNGLASPPAGSRSTRSPRRAGDPLTIGALNRFVPHKRVDVLVRAVAALPGSRLVLGGDGACADELRRLASDLGVTDRVTFLGWVAPGDVLDAVDVFATASTIEAHPMAVLEAQQRGLPVVAGRVGAVPDAVTDGVDGILVPPGDVDALVRALERLQRDPGLASALGAAAAAKMAAGGGAAATAGAYERLYRAVAAGATGRATPGNVVR